MADFDLNAPLEEESDALDLNVRLESRGMKKKMVLSARTTALARGNASLARRPE
jgi:hypothetical protein